MLIKTARLIIQVPKLKDALNWYALHSNIYITQYIDGNYPKQTIHEWLKQDMVHAMKHGFCMGSVFTNEVNKKSRQFVGRAGLAYFNHDATQDVEVGYVLQQEFWGQGLATEIVTALIQWGFANLPITKLIAHVHPENHKSKRVLQKVGMQFSKTVVIENKKYEMYEIRS